MRGMSDHTVGFGIGRHLLCAPYEMVVRAEPATGAAVCKCRTVREIAPSPGAGAHGLYLALRGCLGGDCATGSLICRAGVQRVARGRRSA